MLSGTFIIALPESDLLESSARVEAKRGVVRPTDFQKQGAHSPARELVDHSVEERGPHPSPAEVERYGEVSQLGFIRDFPRDGVAYHFRVGLGDEEGHSGPPKERFEGFLAPWHGIGSPLDLDDAHQIGARGLADAREGTGFRDGMLKRVHVRGSVLC
jgi:hypothetical protein